MTEIERKALALVNEVAGEAHGLPKYKTISRSQDTRLEALCRAIEQHEAFRQKVSDAVVAYLAHMSPWPDNSLRRFIIAKTDPLVEALVETFPRANGAEGMADDLRAALAARGLEITEKKQ